MSHTPTETSETETGNGQQRGRRTLNTDVMRWVSGLVALVGLWILASPFMFESTETAVWSNVIAGAGIFLIAGYNFYRMSRDDLANVGAAALVAVIGVYAIISPYVIEMGSDELLWSTAAAGLVVAILSGYNAYASSRAETAEPAPTRA